MNIRILLGDCRESLRRLPSGSVQCAVTSPPYFGLRDYGHEGQIGLEPTPDEFIAAMVEVFREVHRVLRDDGTLWLNLGDSYAGSWGNSYAQNRGRGNQRPVTVGSIDAGGAARYGDFVPPAANGFREIGIKPKDLLMIPARVAMALQADGWYLRSEIIWAKPNPMPESVTDRPTKSHEHIFLLSKSERYFYDAEAVKEPGVIPAGTLGAKGSAERQSQEGVNARPPEYKVYDGTRNLRDVWTITTKPFSGAHFATFPPDIPERCIKAGTSERGACPHCGAPWTRVTETETMEIRRSARTHEKGRTRASGTMTKAPSSKTIGWLPGCECPDNDPVPCTVLDPFGGAGTTGLVAAKFGRDAVLCELNPAYAEMARARITGDLGEMFTTVKTEAA